MSSSALELNNIVLRAGAGAGKTTTLTHLFLDYASAFQSVHKTFPRVVITTFTRKATQELKERLLELALERGREDLFQFVANKSQVQISTIHGVLSLFLGRYGTKLGLTSDFKLMSVSQEALMRRKILRQLILNHADFEILLETYSFRQLELAAQSYYDNTFLYTELRFIRKEEFAQQLSRLLRGLEDERREVSASILAESSQAAWIKYAEGLQSFSLGQNKNLEETLRSVRQFFEANSRRPSYLAKNPAVSAETAGRLAAFIEKLKDLLASPEWSEIYWEEHEQKNAVFEQLAKRYVEELYAQKIQTGLISMSDLELFSLKLVNEYPDECARFSAEWDYWMIDEYQDTSPVQVALLKNLVGNQKSFVVGDPQQSIYLFRGARSEVFQEKAREVEAAGGEVQQKLINYRSTPGLLAFINDYFARGSASFSAMEPAPGKELGDPALPIVQVRQVEKLETLEGLSEETKASVQRLQELLKQNVPAEQICILSRTRDGLEKIAKAAEVYGVPVQIHVAGGFYQRREVRDALAMLKFLINPHDNVNFLSCLRSPWLNLPDQEILEYCHGQNHSFWSQALRTVTAELSRHPVRQLANYSELARTNGFSFTLRQMMIELGLIDFANRLDATGRREANLWKLISGLFETERMSGANFLNFLEGLEASLDVEANSEDSDATPVIAPKRVNLMTVHASKGLQFEHVIVIGMTKKPRLSHSELFSLDETEGRWSLSLMNEEEKKIQPSALALAVREKYNARELEEHARVLYVALTRAKSGLTLIFEGKSEKNSWAQDCPLSLAEGHHQEKEYSYEVLAGSFSPEVQLRTEVAREPDPGAWQDPAEGVALQTVAVTKMIESENSRASRSTIAPSVDLQKALAKAYRGTEAHRIFESLKYVGVKEISEIVEDEELQAAIDFIARAKEVPLLEIIRAGFAEWGFSFRERKLWINGQIDLWGEVNGEVWLVDYKTGSSENSQSAFDQLKAYAWALLQMKYVKAGQKVHLVVVYPFEKLIKTERDYYVDPEKYLARIWEK